MQTLYFMKFKYLLVFLLGFLSCLCLFCVLEYSNNNFPNFKEVPFGTGLVGLSNVAPLDRIPEEDIIVLEDMVILKIAGATLSSYSESGSMRPLFDEGANGIRIVPESEEDVNVGDIISYRVGDILAVHRVVEKGVDEEGIYFITQGDNNLVNDEKIRFKDIEFVTIGIIY